MVLVIVIPFPFFVLISEVNVLNDIVFVIIERVRGNVLLFFRGDPSSRVIVRNFLNDLILRWIVSIRRFSKDPRVRLVFVRSIETSSLLGFSLFSFLPYYVVFPFTIFLSSSVWYWLQYVKNGLGVIDSLGIFE